MMSDVQALSIATFAKTCIFCAIRISWPMMMALANCYSMSLLNKLTLY